MKGFFKEFVFRRKKYMKNAMLILLAVVMFLSGCAGGSTGNSEPVVLRYSSFAGGGYDYTAEVDDPSVVRCDTSVEFEPGAEELEGASFDFVVTLTGLKPGTTRFAIHGRSPIIEPTNSYYTVTVDEQLRVTLTPLRSISSFFITRSGEIYYDTYRITLEEDGYYLSVSDREAQRVHDKKVNDLMDVIETYDMVSWDGFSESRSFVLDGEGFRLEFTLTDGTSVEASGSNAFPDHYFNAIGEIWDILSTMQGWTTWD